MSTEKDVCDMQFAHVAAAILALKEQIATRIDAIDRASVVLAETLNRVPTLLEREVVRLGDVIDEKFASISALMIERDRLADIKFKSVESEFGYHNKLNDEKFFSIQRQFEERDVRTDQDKQAATTAVNAALQAQKEAAGAQNIANAAAIYKSETGFTREIEGLKEANTTTKDALSAQINNVNSRMDRGEGAVNGSGERKRELGLTIGSTMAIIGGVVSVLAVLAMVATNLNHSAAPQAQAPYYSAPQK